jgi:hypothetical protein
MAASGRICDLQMGRSERKKGTETFSLFRFENKEITGSRGKSVPSPGGWVLGQRGTEGRGYA